VLTKLRNRAWFEDELNRLERRGPWPVTVVAIDLNRLKMVNDRSGHAAGDALLRRAGEVLAKLADKAGLRGPHRRRRVRAAAARERRARRLAGPWSVWRR